MIECFISVFLLIAGVWYQDPLYFIASGVFAIAHNVISEED